MTDNQASQVPATWTGFGDLSSWFGPERMRRYLMASDSDETRAASLYRWNAAMAAAFFEALGYLEVILRNAMHRQLSLWHHRRGRVGEWYDDPTRVLDDRCAGDIAYARQRIARRGAPEAPGRVVAELTLGFWRFLLDQRHQQILWAQALHRAFPGLPIRRRGEVQRPVNRLHRLRNRIAHHEPIHHEDLAGLHNDLLMVVGWIDPNAAAWLESACSRLARLLTMRP